MTDKFRFRIEDAATPVIEVDLPPCGNPKTVTVYTIRDESNIYVDVSVRPDSDPFEAAKHVELVVPRSAESIAAEKRESAMQALEDVRRVLRNPSSTTLIDNFTV